MIYRHKITGVEIDVNSELSGAWEPVKPNRPAEAEAPKPAAKPAPKTAAKPAAKKRG